MGRRKSWPVPENRTVNEPIEVVSPETVLALYNQDNRIKFRDKIDSQVKEWFIGEAKKLGWDEVTFYGHQCLLTAFIRIVVSAANREARHYAPAEMRRDG